MYDLNDDGVISKDELCGFISLMIGGSIAQEQVRDALSLSAIERGQAWLQFLLACFLLHLETKLVDNGWTLQKK